MDFFTGLFDDLIRWMMIICVEAPIAIALIGSVLWALVKWADSDADERKRLLIIVAILSASFAGVHWFLRTPNFMSITFSLVPMLIAIAIAGWLFFQFAITSLGGQIDEGLGNLREIAQNSRRDKF